MISLKELNPHSLPTTPEIEANLAILNTRLNALRMAYNAPFIITSGLRSTSQQKALIEAGKSSAPHSKHLSGEAADVYDPKGKLKEWILANIKLIEETKVWMEAFESTPTWVHFQIVPPKSGNRFFIP